MQATFEYNNLTVVARAKRVTSYGTFGLELIFQDKDGNEVEWRPDESTLEEIKEQANEALYEAQYELGAAT